jgi:hypothetical protein
MSTRGYFGFFYKGKYYLMYNHYDSFPSFLGRMLVEEIKRAIADGTFETWIEMFKNVKFYKPNENMPIDENKIKQSFLNILKEGHMMLDGDKDNLMYDTFIEYSYVLNFDADIFMYFDKEGNQRYFKLNDLDDWEDKLPYEDDEDN